MSVMVFEDPALSIPHLTFHVSFTAQGDLDRPLASPLHMCLRDRTSSSARSFATSEVLSASL